MEIKTAPCPLGAKCEYVKDDVLYRCPWFKHLRGKDPQSDQEVDQFDCAIGWLPMLMVEHSLFVRQTGAAVESFRNEMSKQNNQLATLLLNKQPDPKLIDGDSSGEN